MSKPPSRRRLRRSALGVATVSQLRAALQLRSLAHDSLPYSEEDERAIDAVVAAASTPARVTWRERVFAAIADMPVARVEVVAFDPPVDKDAGVI